MRSHSVTVLQLWTTVAWNCSSHSLEPSRGQEEDRRCAVACREGKSAAEAPHSREWELYFANGKYAQLGLIESTTCRIK